MRLTSLLAAVAATSSVALAETSSWSDWAPGQPATTTITKTLLHVNETMTMTSYSSTGTASKMVANATEPAYTKPTTVAAGSTTAAIASFSSGAAVPQEANIAIAAIAGVGAVAYGLF